MSAAELHSVLEGYPRAELFLRRCANLELDGNQIKQAILRDSTNAAHADEWEQVFRKLAATCRRMKRKRAMMVKTIPARVVKRAFLPDESATTVAPVRATTAASPAVASNTAGVSSPESVQAKPQVAPAPAQRPAAGNGGAVSAPVAQKNPGQGYQNWVRLLAEAHGYENKPFPSPIPLPLGGIHPKTGLQYRGWDPRKKDFIFGEVPHPQNPSDTAAYKAWAKADPWHAVPSPDNIELTADTVSELAPPSTDSRFVTRQLPPGTQPSPFAARSQRASFAPMTPAEMQASVKNWAIDKEYNVEDRIGPDGRRVPVGTQDPENGQIYVGRHPITNAEMHLPGKVPTDLTELGTYIANNPALQAVPKSQAADPQTRAAENAALEAGQVGAAKAKADWNQVQPELAARKADAILEGAQEGAWRGAPYAAGFGLAAAAPIALAAGGVIPPVFGVGALPTGLGATGAATTATAAAGLASQSKGRSIPRYVGDTVLQGLAFHGIGRALPTSGTEAAMLAATQSQAQTEAKQYALDEKKYDHSMSRLGAYQEGYNKIKNNPDLDAEAQSVAILDLVNQFPDLFFGGDSQAAPANSAAEVHAATTRVISDPTPEGKKEGLNSLTNAAPEVMDTNLKEWGLDTPEKRQSFLESIKRPDGTIPQELLTLDHVQKYIHDQTPPGGDPMATIQQWWSNSDSVSRALVAVGLPLGMISLLASLFGNSGAWGALGSALGLSAGVYGLARTGVLKGTPLEGMGEGMLNLTAPLEASIVKSQLTPEQLKKIQLVFGNDFIGKNFFSPEQKKKLLEPFVPYGYGTESSIQRLLPYWDESKAVAPAG